MPGWYKIGSPLPATWRGRPPQMLAEDIPRWWQYLERPGTPKYINLFYNVAMTVVDPQDIQGNSVMIDMWMYNISKRVDVMAETEKEMHVIEVTTRAGVRSIGQAILYTFLYDETKPFPKPRIPMIVCDYADPDIQALAIVHGVEIVELRPINMQQAITQTILGG